MPIAKVNGTELYYEARGEGPVCLALHGGLGIDHQYLRHTLGPLEKGMRMVYYDHRCNGRSGRPAIETLTIEQLADDADALAAHVGRTTWSCSAIRTAGSWLKSSRCGTLGGYGP